MISAPISRPHHAAAPLPRPDGSTPRLHDATAADIPGGPSSAKILGQGSNGQRPLSAAPQFWNRAQSPQQMSAERLLQAISALEGASQRLAHGGGSVQVAKSTAERLRAPAQDLGMPRIVHHPAVTTSAFDSAMPAADSALAMGKKADFVATFASNDLHALLVLLLQVQNGLARTQADVMQMALRQIMAATHARANSIRLDAAVAFGVAIGAAVLSIGLNVAGTRKSLQGLAKRDTINTKFGVADKTWQDAQSAAIRQPGDTPATLSTRAHSKATARAAYRAASGERDLELTKVDRMQLKGNAMIQGARIASELMGAFGALSSGLQRVSQTYAETNKTMAELWRAQGQAEMDQRRQATAEVLNLVKSLHALEQRGWSDVRIA